MPLKDVLHDVSQVKDIYFTISLNRDRNLIEYDADLGVSFLARC